MTTLASMQANEICVRSRALREQLLPGIPDEITLDSIAPKLHWTDFSSLLSVCHAWLHAIRTHRVYNARVRSHSTETLLLLNSTDSENFDKIALFDTTENSFHQLPPIPNLEGGFPRSCKFVSLDGKVYALGGLVDPKIGEHSTDTVYVLDLAGRWQWKQCASMIQSRQDFGCGVLYGKLYVFGGTCSLQPVPMVPGSEVYDPKENNWSPIKPMLSLRCGQRVDTVGEELFVHGGFIFDRDYFDFRKNQMMGSDDSSDDDDHFDCANSLEVYHHGKAEWRELQPFTHNMTELFMANGQIHGITSSDYPDFPNYVQSYVYDLDTCLWTHQHSFYSDAIELNGESVYVHPCSVLMVEDELFALILWYKRGEGFENRRFFRKIRYSLVQCKEFGSKDKDCIMWKLKAHFPRSAFNPIELCSVIKL